MTCLVQVLFKQDITDTYLPVLSRVCWALCLTMGAYLHTEPNANQGIVKSLRRNKQPDTSYLRVKVMDCWHIAGGAEVHPGSVTETR